MKMQEKQRNSDILAENIKDRIEDFINERRQYDEKTEEWRNKFEQEIYSIKKNLDNLNWPYSIIKWVFISVFTGLFVKIGNEIVTFFKATIK